MSIHSHLSLIASLMLINLLFRLDTTPSILDNPINSVSKDEGTHGAKRTKLSEPAEKSSITSRVNSKLYTSIEVAAADVEAGVSRVVHELQQKLSASNEQPLSTHTRELRAEIARALAFKQKFDSLILREIIQRPQVFNQMRTFKDEDKDSVDSGDAKSAGLINGNGTGASAVLTLYGSAPQLGNALQPKQLFSSLQQAIGKDSKSSTLKANKGIPEEDPISAASPPGRKSIREHALPNGISVTTVIPVHSRNSSDGKKTKIPTLGEIFPPPSNLAPLNPPKQSRHSATRSSSVTWYNAAESTSSSKPHRRDTFSVQPQPTCDWLTYNVPTQLPSPEARRRQRDRALSVNEPSSSVPQEAITAHSQAKEDALFRSVYSSFAPDRDNAGALITDHTKNRMWWKRYGENRYQSIRESGFAPPADEDVSTPEFDESVEDEFKGVADDWTPEELPPELNETNKIVHLEVPKDMKEVDDILLGISDLLETLNSYQRNRNLSLANNARNIATSQLVSASGSPTSPSSAEHEVFHMLQSQLALMVATLPPCALAKLEGDKLGVLNINTKIQTQDKHYKGTMEEDEVFLKAKQAPTTPAIGYPPRNINPPLSVPARSNSYVQTANTPSQPIQRTNYATQPRPVGAAASYLPNQQYSSRPASSNHYFPNPSYSTSRTAPMTSERYSYGASQQYSQRLPHSPQIQQSNGYRPYTPVNGPSYSQQYSAPQQGASSASVPGPGLHNQRPSQPGYQQRAMNSQTYGSESTPAARETSPSKPNAPFAPQTPRPAYSSQGQVASQQRPPIYHQHSAQYGPQTPVPRQVNGSNTTSSGGQHTHMTAEEQSALMNRQKAQLAEQQSAAAKQQKASGTPHAANGQYGGQHNGVPMVQPNGVTAGQSQ